jgi:hypothetical protein
MSTALADFTQFLSIIYPPFPDLQGAIFTWSRPSKMARGDPCTPFLLFLSSVEASAGQWNLGWGEHTPEHVCGFFDHPTDGFYSVSRSTKPTTWHITVSGLKLTLRVILVPSVLPFTVLRRAPEGGVVKAGVLRVHRPLPTCRLPPGSPSTCLPASGQRQGSVASGYDIQGHMSMRRIPLTSPVPYNQMTLDSSSL